MSKLKVIDSYHIWKLLSNKISDYDKKTGLQRS